MNGILKLFFSLASLQMTNHLAVFDNDVMLWVQIDLQFAFQLLRHLLRAKLVEGQALVNVEVVLQ